VSRKLQNLATNKEFGSSAVDDVHDGVLQFLENCVSHAVDVGMFEVEHLQSVGGRKRRTRGGRKTTDEGEKG
jgi:hypothetical protein